MARRRQPGGLEAITEIARELFSERGYDGTSMQDIADAAQLHKSSLYHYVRSKDELLREITMGRTAALAASLAAAEAADATPGERVILAFRGAIDAALGDLEGMSLVLTQRAGSPVGTELAEARRDYDRRFSALVAAAQAAGEARTDLDPLLATRLLLGMINWLVEWYRPASSRFPPDTVTDALVAMATGGLRDPG